MIFCCKGITNLFLSLVVWTFLFNKCFLCSVSPLSRLHYSTSLSLSLRKKKPNEPDCLSFSLTLPFLSISRSYKITTNLTLVFSNFWFNPSWNFWFPNREVKLTSVVLMVLLSLSLFYKSSINVCMIDGNWLKLILNNNVEYIWNWVLPAIIELLFFVP